MLYTSMKQHLLPISALSGQEMS